MDPVMVPLLVFSGLAACLVVLSVVLVSGAWLVRRLRLPQDLPDSALFACPAPALHAPCAGGELEGICAAHDQLAATLAEAEQAYQQVCELRAWQAAWRELPEGPLRAQHLAALSEPVRIGTALAEELEGLLNQRDYAAVAAWNERCVARCAAWHRAAQGSREALPAPDHRRLLFLLAALAGVCLCWYLALRWLEAGSVL